MKVTYKFINDVFRGRVYGQHDIFTARSFSDFIHRHDVDVARAVNAYDDGAIVGTLLYARRNDRAWLSLMGVLPRYRRMSIGRTLFSGAVDVLIESNIRAMEFEAITRNAPVQAMYAPFGFSEVDRLCIWARGPRKDAGGLPRATKRTLAAIRKIAHAPATCWQRDSLGVSRASASSLIECDGAYAFVRVRDEHAVILDAGAEHARAARDLIALLDRRIRYDITLVNEPESSPLSKALGRGGWRVIDRQHRMMRTR